MPGVLPLATIVSVQGLAPARPVKPRLPGEDQLIARAVTGDADAFRRLYDGHRVDVARLVYRMLGARSDLEDVVQEVFVQVYKSLKDFRGQSKFSTWLHRVTVNVVLMHRRSARSRPMFADEPPADPALRSDGIAPDEDAERRRESACAHLRTGFLGEASPRRSASVFILHELEARAAVGDRQDRRGARPHRADASFLRAT